MRYNKHMKKTNGFSTVVFIFIASILITTFLLLVWNLKFKMTRQKPSTINNRQSQTQSKEKTDSVKSNGKLIKEKLSDGNIKVTNLLGNFEITVPSTYEISDGEENFLIAFNGPDSFEGSTPVLRDFAQLHFIFNELKAASLEEEVKGGYRLSRENEGSPVNYGDIQKLTLGNAQGYSYSCPFLVSQKCIYLPLKNDSEKYLTITKVIADDNNRGYSKELDQILSTLKFK